MVVRIMIIGDHQDVHHLIEVVEVILLGGPLMLKDRGGTDQGPTLLMEAPTEDMGVALVPIPDKIILESNLRTNGTRKLLLAC